MKLVFGLYKYFPFGGLQKDMLAIAYECAARGHQISLFCQSWQGPYPSNANMEVNVLPNKTTLWFGRSNHARNTDFARRFQQAVNQIKPDLVVGFNKISGIDIYYAADTCFKAKLYRERPWFYRVLPRYRGFIREETALFSYGRHTHILAIAQSAINEYRKYYQTEPERFTLLPPGINRDRINVTGERLYELHEELGITRENRIILMIGSGFRTKGLDRAIEALASLPDSLKPHTHLVVVGEDKTDFFLQQAQQKKVRKQVHFLGGRNDIPRLLHSADVLIHPAYRENTGTVLLEAGIAGLPVITTDVCGYSHYITENNLGMVLPSPFQQINLNDVLLIMLTDNEKMRLWRSNSKKFSQRNDLYNMPTKATDVIELIAKQRQPV